MPSIYYATSANKADVMFVLSMCNYVSRITEQEVKVI